NRTSSGCERTASPIHDGATTSVFILKGLKLDHGGHWAATEAHGERKALMHSGHCSTCHENHASPLSVIPCAYPVSSVMSFCLSARRGRRPRPACKASRNTDSATRASSRSACRRAGGCS